MKWRSSSRRRMAGALTASVVLCVLGCGPAAEALPNAASLPSSVPVQTSPTFAPAISVPTAAPSPTPTPVPVIGPDSYPEGVNPLTGLPVTDPAALQRRPLLVKISNAPPIVRPQSGVSFADLVFEHYAEGGQTRFSALFYSQGAPHVGSVRSTRLIDLQLAPAYDAILVFSGGSLGVIDSVRQSKLYPFNVISPQFGYGPPYFVRFPRPGLPVEHTLFTDTAQLWQWTLDKHVRQQARFGTPGMAFSSMTPSGGVPVSSAQLDYARTSVVWRYDALTGVFLRWSDGIPHLDALTGAQLAFQNVIVLSAFHDEVSLFPEKYHGAEKSIFIDLQGEGPVTLLRDGQAYEGRWHRAAPTDPFSFTGLDGKPLLLKPGKTFFQIIRAGFEQLVINP